jgi:hypothetical protein
VGDLLREFYTDAAIEMEGLRGKEDGESLERLSELEKLLSDEPMAAAGATGDPFVDAWWEEEEDK